MTAMNELESVKRSLEQIAKSNAEAAAWRAELDAWRAELDKWRAKAEAWRAVADKRHAESEAANKAANKKLQKAIAKAAEAKREMYKEIGGITNTRGSATEEFFFRALNKEPRLGDLEFEYVRANVRVSRRGREGEFDILMMNGEVVAVIEVKHKLRCEDVERMREWTLPNFRRLMREYDDNTLAPAMACIIAQRDALALAHQYGYAVLRPGGQRVHADVSHLRYLPRRRHRPTLS